jgi:hypothetical protein
MKVPSASAPSLWAVVGVDKWGLREKSWIDHANARAIGVVSS